MKEKSVSVIVVNFNGGKVFDVCLESLSKLDYKSWELIVVDNGSVDDSFELVHNYNFPKIKVIQNDDNKGFAPANNQGYGVSSGEYVLFLNNDTSVPRNLLKMLVSKMERDVTIGVMQPKIELMDKAGVLDNAGSFMTRTGFLTHWGFMEKDAPEFSKEREVFSVKGACMITRRTIIEEGGLFDERFVSYFEESDFCWRVWLQGYRAIYYPEVKIKHKLGYTSSKMAQSDVNYHSLKNRIASLVKNLGQRNLLLMLLPHLVLVFALGVYYLLRLKLGQSYMFFKAVWWNIANLRETLKERSKVQAKRKVSDKEIFAKTMVGVNFINMFRHFRRVDSNIV